MVIPWIICNGNNPLLFFYKKSDFFVFQKMSNFWLFVKNRKNWQKKLNFCTFLQPRFLKKMFPKSPYKKIAIFHFLKVQKSHFFLCFFDPDLDVLNNPYLKKIRSKKGPKKWSKKSAILRFCHTLQGKNRWFLAFFHFLKPLIWGRVI